MMNSEDDRDLGSLSCLLGIDDLTLVFQYLDPIALARAAQVCKEWYDVARENFLWRPHCLRRWAFCNLGAVDGKLLNGSKENQPGPYIK